jgi:hypothetical protein
MIAVSAQLPVSSVQRYQLLGSLAIKQALEERTGEPEDLLVTPKLVFAHQHLHPAWQLSIPAERGMNVHLFVLFFFSLLSRF